MGCRYGVHVGRQLGQTRAEGDRLFLPTPRIVLQARL